MMKRKTDGCGVVSRECSRRRDAQGKRCARDTPPNKYNREALAGANEQEQNARGAREAEGA